MAHDVVGAILGTMECPPPMLSEELPIKSKRSDSTVETGKNMLREAGKNNENRSENVKHNEQGHENNDAITQKQNEKNKMAAVQAKHGGQNKAKAGSTKTNKQSTSTSYPNKKSKGSCDSKSSSSKSHRDTVNRKEFEKVTDQLKHLTNLVSNIGPVLQELRSSRQTVDQFETCQEEDNLGDEEMEDSTTLESDTDHNKRAYDDLSDGELPNEKNVDGNSTSQKKTKYCHEGTVENNDSVLSLDNVLDSMVQEVANVEQTGPEIEPRIAAIVDTIASKGISDEALEEKTKAVFRPKNCAQLGKIKVNQTIWDDLTLEARQKDARMQKTLNKLHTGMIPLVELADRVAAGIKEGKQLISPEETLKKLTQSIVVLASASHDINMKRRELIKPHLVPKYKPLCSGKNPIKSELFGDDLQATCKEISETKHLTYNSMNMSYKGKSGNLKQFSGNYGNQTYKGPKVGNTQYKNYGNDRHPFLGRSYQAGSKMRQGPPRRGKHNAGYNSYKKSQY